MSALGGRRDEVIPAWCFDPKAQAKTLSIKVLSVTIALANSVGVAEVFNTMILLVNKLSIESKVLLIRFVASILVDYDDRSSIIRKHHKNIVKTSLIIFEKYECGNDKDSKHILTSLNKIFSSMGEYAETHLIKLYRVLVMQLRHESHLRRRYACDAVAIFSPIFHSSKDKKLLAQLASALYENLGEEYPTTLASVLNALAQVVSCVDSHELGVSIGDIVRDIVPVLKNRHEKVQRYCILLLGSIARDYPSCISPREWMKICIELTEMLKAKRKSVRRAAVESFGLVANVIGPQDVIYTLLQNLRAQERQNRVCTTVAVAIVAKQCEKKIDGISGNIGDEVKVKSRERGTMTLQLRLGMWSERHAEFKATK
eukprot:g5213.t1